MPVIEPSWAENMPRPDLIDEIETLRDALRSWQDAAAKASKEVIAADGRLRGAVETLEGLEQLFEDRERAGEMHREDQAWRLVAAALRSARGQ